MYLSLVFLNSLHYADYNKKLKLCHINARSLLAYNNDFRSNLVKMDEIRLVLCEHFEYDIIAISETWLSETTQNDCSDLYLPNYTIFRKDRKTPNSRGGGVAFDVSNNIKVIQRFDLSSEKIELLWLEITTNNKTLLIGVCYRPPGKNRTDATLFLNELELSLENVKKLRSDVTILMGILTINAIAGTMTTVPVNSEGSCMT